MSIWPAIATGCMQGGADVLGLGEECASFSTNLVFIKNDIIIHHEIELAPHDIWQRNTYSQAFENTDIRKMYRGLQ